MMVMPISTMTIEKALAMLDADGVRCRITGRSVSAWGTRNGKWWQVRVRRRRGEGFAAMVIRAAGSFEHIPLAQYRQPITGGESAVNSVALKRQQQREKRNKARQRPDLVLELWNRLKTLKAKD